MKTREVLVQHQGFNVKEKYSSQIQKIKAIQGEMRDAGIMLWYQCPAQDPGDS